MKIKKESIRFSFLILLMFMTINSFYIVRPINSTMVVSFLCIILCIISEKLRHIFSNVIKIKELYIILCMFLGLFFITSLIPLLHQTYDFVYSKNTISQIINTIILLPIIVVVIGYSSNDVDRVSYFERIFVYSFCFQTIVQLLAFISPTFLTIVHSTYSQLQIGVLFDSYHGVRGLALSGSPGWGLTIGYGISFILYIKTFIIRNKITLRAIIVGLLLVVGNFFAGRSGYVGLIIALLFYFFADEIFILKAKKYLLVITLSVFSIIYIYFFTPDILDKFSRISHFAFEFYYTYEKTGKIATRSTDILIEMWNNVTFSYNTFLLGDGLFILPDGSYYQHTDVGVLRNLLFGGFFLYLYIIICQMYLCGFLYLFDKKTTDKLFIFLMFIMFMIFEMKAMTLMYNKYVYIYCIMFIIIYAYNKRYYRKGYNA